MTRRFTISPGVNVREIDLSNVIPAVSTTLAGYAGHFQWGPVNRIISVSNALELTQMFGGPRQGSQYAEYNRSFLTAESFLQYGDELLVSRAVEENDPTLANAFATSYNSSATLSGGIYSEKEDVENNPIDSGIPFVARYPGELGNSIDVIITHRDIHGAFADGDAENIFNSALINDPETSPWGEVEGVENDEISIIVIDSLGNITGRRGEILEVFENVSLEPLAKTADGARNYAPKHINEVSRFVFVNEQELTNGLFVKTGNVWSANNFYADSEGYDVVFELENGANESSFSPAAIKRALQPFYNDETVDISLIFAQGGSVADVAEQRVIANALITLAETRRDCIAVLSPPITGQLTNSSTLDTIKTDEVVDYFRTFNSSSYAVFASTPVYVYNRYIDEFQWIGSQGHIAGLCVHTDFVAEPWFSPAGLNRGHLRSVTKIALTPSKANRDTLYKNRINPIVNFPGQGTLLYGDKTALSRPSALDRINVRRLLIVMQKAISTAAKFQLFELNDEITRTVFVNSVEPYLRDILSRRGLNAFKVVCDETNNTPEVIDNNRFVGDIYVQPARSINYIDLNFIITRTGVDFAEIIALRTDTE